MDFLIQMTRGGVLWKRDGAALMAALPAEAGLSDDLVGEIRRWCEARYSVEFTPYGGSAEAHARTGADLLSKARNALRKGDSIAIILLSPEEANARKPASG